MPSGVPVSYRPLRGIPAVRLLGPGHAPAAAKPQFHGRRRGRGLVPGLPVQPLRQVQGRVAPPQYVVVADHPSITYTPRLFISCILSRSLLLLNPFCICCAACRCGGSAPVPERQAGAVGVELHGRARLLPDPDGEAVGALHQQPLQGVRAAFAGARVPRGRQAGVEGGRPAPVPQARDARRRAAGPLLRRHLHVRAAQATQVLRLTGSGGVRVVAGRVLPLLICCRLDDK